MTLVRALSEYIPIRNTSVWPNFTSIETLKHVTGEAIVEPVQYDQSGYVWHVADHPVVNIPWLKRGGSYETAFTWYHDVDLTGHACTFIKLNTPASPGDLQVRVQGKRHPTTGVLMTGPADNIWDILAMSRADVLEGDFDIFRRECQELGITIDGVLDDHTRTTRSIFDEIRESTGSVWSAAMKNFFRVYPNEMNENEPIYQEFNDRNIFDVSAVADHTDLFTVFRIYYDYNHATGEPQKVLQLEATSKIKDYDRVEKEYYFKWINKKWLASQIGTRLLQYFSRPRWKTVFSSDLPVVPSGGYVSFEHMIIPSDVWGNAMVLSSEFTPTETKKSYYLELPVGTAPDIDITRDSEIYE